MAGNYSFTFEVCYKRDLLHLQKQEGYNKTGKEIIRINF
jgi:hypothetical protein